MHKYARVFLFILLSLSQGAFAQGVPTQDTLDAQSGQGANATDGDNRYFGDQERGWFWYQDPPPEQDEEKPKEPLRQAPSTKPAEDPQEMLKLYQKHLDDAKALAVMRPTDENVRRYIEVQKEVYDRSALFADTWRRVVWTNPALDYSLEHPTNNPGNALDQQQTRLAQANAVAALADTDGLFFFFSSDCGHCHTQAPILEQFSRHYGIKIMAVSLDGGVLPEFPNAVPDNGLAARLGVAVTPALFMANPRNQEITPVGYGVMTEAELVQRIYTLTVAKRGKF